MTIQGRRFPRPWRKVRSPQGFLVIDNEGKRLAVAIGSDKPANFADLSLSEAEAIADTIVRVPELLDVEAKAGKPAPLEPLIVLTQSEGAWYILRDCNGVLQRSRPFESKESAVYACVVWYGGEPAMPIDQTANATQNGQISDTPSPGAQTTDEPPPPGASIDDGK